jgi:hypothetical protein
MPYCENCGNKVSDTSKFCSNCGKTTFQVENPTSNSIQADVQFINLDTSYKVPEKNGDKDSLDDTFNKARLINDVSNKEYFQEKEVRPCFHIDKKSNKFPHHRYIIGLIVLIIPGIIIHWYFMDGTGKENLRFLINHWGDIGRIPIQEAMWYDFHYTWATYTFPQIIVVGIFWIFKYNEFNFNNSVGKDQQSITSPIIDKDSAGIR